MSTATQTGHSAAGSATGFAEAAKRAWQAYKTWSERRRATAYMNNMSDHELKDIGVERWQISQAVRNGRSEVRETGAYWL